MDKEVKECRICGNNRLISIINLGNMFLTGVFPKNKDHILDSTPLELVKCDESNKGCGLVQLRHTPDLSKLYGDNYGYRSGLNQSMVNHLNSIVNKNLSIVKPGEGDLVIDIGSNDGTLLKFYPINLKLIGIDPTGKKFKKFYPENVELIPDFFSSELIRENFDEKAKIITSIAMFYDLEKPMDFMREIYEILDDNGIWVFEQNYMPKMLEVNAYDTICQEHIEYYRLKQIKWMCDKVGFKIIDVEMNDINGGSFAIIVAKRDSDYKEARKKINAVLKNEKKLESLEPYKKFCERVFEHKKELLKIIKDIKENGSKIYGYGASTKGNVILQFCGLNEKDIVAIGEVNEDKFGAFTPGTRIPIIPENEAKKNAEYLMVLPWHFKDFIVKKEKGFLEKGGKLLFPLPEPHIVEKERF